MNSRTNRAVGALMGAFIGDALGLVVIGTMISKNFAANSGPVLPCVQPRIVPTQSENPYQRVVLSANRRADTGRLRIRKFTYAYDAEREALDVEGTIRERKKEFLAFLGGSPGIHFWAKYGNVGKLQFAQPPVNELLRKAQPFGHSPCRT